MTTLLLSARYSEDSIMLRNAALALGWSVERIHNRRDVEWLKGRDIAIYGEWIFTQMVAEVLDVRLIEPAADWLLHIPEKFRQRDVHAMLLSDTRKITTPTFIKPAEGKPFESQVYSSGTDLPALPDDLPVLTAEPLVWEAEYRCFVAEGKVATLCFYLQNGELTKNEEGTWPETGLEEARTFAEQVLSEVSFPVAGVLDVGQIQGRGWAVVEANPAWASGIYGCDPSQVLQVIKRANQ